MKNKKKRLVTYLKLTALLIGITYLLSSKSIYAGVIGATDLLRMRPTDISQFSEPVTFLYVSSHGDSITRIINIGNTMKNNLLSFHSAVIIGSGGGDIKVKIAGNKDDEVMFGSFGIALVTDEEGSQVIIQDFGYAEYDGDYTLTFSTLNTATAIIFTAPLYTLGVWSVPITLEMTVSME